MDHKKQNILIFIFTLFSAFCIAEPLHGHGDPFEDLPELLEERTRCLVAIEFFIQHEIERQPGEAVGLVLDKEGLIILLDSELPNWEPAGKFKDFKIFPLGEDSEGYAAEYLGWDYIEGYHFLRADKVLMEHVTPVTAFESAEPVMGEPVWGIGLLDKDYLYRPYPMIGRMVLVQELPLRYGFSSVELAAPGGPVFNCEGKFIGWAVNASTQDRVLYMGREQYQVAIRNPRESNVFLFAREFFEEIRRLPESPLGDTYAWMGVSGLQTLDREVSKFMGLNNQGALVVSHVLTGSPAEAGGLQDRDIIISVDDEALPKFYPDYVIKSYFERILMPRAIGSTVTLGIVRGSDEPVEVTITLGESPKSLSRAKREYFGDLGISVREFVLYDAISRRMEIDEMMGVIASFVRPNSPTNTAGLRSGDWIKEIDGRVVNSVDDAISLLQVIDDDENREEFVLLIDRNNETSVIRVKLK